MAKFIVTGGPSLSGEVQVQGSKNAAFPVMAACLLAAGHYELSNVPEIADVRNFLEIMKFLGADFEFKSHILNINTEKIQNRDLPQDLMGKLRGSIVIVGALLSRFGKVRFAYPGGDAIGKRPINEHLEGFKKLGASVQENKGLIEIKAAPKLQGNKIVLATTTVTGTENLILAAVLAQGISEIRLAACEPHVQSLCYFLTKMGAKIEGIGTPNLRIAGAAKLQGARFSLNPDEIDTMTFAVAAAATKGQVRITGVDLQALDAPLGALARMGVNFATSPGNLEIMSPLKPYTSTQIVTGVYPQLLTDYQPLLGVLATQAQGETRIHDWIYEGRQGYLQALQEMGARVEFDDVHRARIYGPSELSGAEIRTPDIRAGASILIAALLAKGQSVIYNAEIIDRGYEKIEERLRSLGAKIERVE